MQFDQQPTQKKSFWSRPEGTTGMIVVAGLVSLAAIFGLKIAPLITLIFTNIFTMTVTGVGLYALIKILTNKKFKLAISNLFKTSMRWLTSWVITIDPIAILKNYVDHLREKYNEMEEKIAMLNGSIKQLEFSKNDNDKKITDCLKRAEFAKGKNLDQDFLLNKRQAVRLKDVNENYASLLAKLKNLHTILIRYRDAAKVMIIDTQNNVEAKEKEFKALKQGYSAMKSAMSILMGDEQKELFDQSMEFVVNDVAMKVGEIDAFMERSSDYLRKVDLENGLADESGNELFDKWMKQDSILLKEDKKLVIDKDGGLEVKSTENKETVWFDKKSESKYF